MMPETTRLKFQIWSQDDEYQRLLDETNSLLAKWSKEYTAPMVSVSGGKDSTVMLHLILQHWPGDQVVVWHWDYGALSMPRSFARECLTIIKAIIGDTGAQLISRRYYYTPHSFLGKMFGWIKKVARETERDCSFVGLRAEESGSREKKTRDHVATDSVTNLPALYPMRHWRSGDCWAYIASQRIPHHSLYDVQAPMRGGYDSPKLRMSVVSFDYAGDGAEAWMPDGVLLWRQRHQMKEVKSMTKRPKPVPGRRRQKKA